MVVHTDHKWCKMTDTKQLRIWKSQFGEEYTDRNIIDPKVLIPGFRRMVGNLDIKRILEIGCNRGHNLIALSEIGEYDLIGIEPLQYAVLEARAASNRISVLDGDCFSIPFIDSYFDLVFTSGVLIHIAPEDQPRAIDEMYRVSNRYLLVIEYYAKPETLVHYRGYNDLLWKSDFKNILLQQKPSLECVDEGLWDTKNWIDNCNWWLFEKKE